jgi:hypothetical protein
MLINDDLDSHEPRGGQVDVVGKADLDAEPDGHRIRRLVDRADRARVRNREATPVS